MSVLKLKLLGQLECQAPDGALISLSTRKSEVLLAYLALAPGVRHPRERLINLLWSDRGEQQARNSLRQALSAIKKSLDSVSPQLLEVDRTTVRINPDLIQVDAHEFDALSAETDIDNLSKAATLYQGEFLEGIMIRDSASQEWLSNERERCKRQLVEVLSSLGHMQISNGLHIEAIESAEHLVVHDPLHEYGWRMLMRAYHEKGDRNHALLSYRRCSKVLNNELGIGPEAETTELRDSIIGGNLGDRKVMSTSSISSAVTGKDPAPDTGGKDHSILVLPFEDLSNDPDQQYFSDGLTEGIIMGLSLFPSLKVHSRHSSFAAANKNWSISEIGQKFQSLYVVEGSVRKSPGQVRISAQLVNTRSGEQIWGKRFDSNLELIFSLEDQITQSIVGIIKGKIDITDQQIAYHKPAKDMHSYDLLMRGRYHLLQFNPQDHRIGMEMLQKCLETDPDNAEAHADMYRCHSSDWLAGWNESRSEALNNMSLHIRKALELKPDDSGIQSSYAEYLAFIGEFEQAEAHADRALQLNPNDIDTLAIVSGVQASLGNVQKSLAMADTCQRLDPFHPLTVWITGIAYYRGKKYQDSLNAFKNITNPTEEIDGWIAACYQRLGMHGNAVKHLNLYLEKARENMAKFPESLDEWKLIWHTTAAYRHEEGIDYPFDALCDAGLKDFVEESSRKILPDNTHSILVLPFENLSNDPDQQYFSDGLTEGIIMGLSLFPSLKVHSRNSSFAAAAQNLSMKDIGREFQSLYVVEGSVRKSSDQVRISAHLVNSENGEQIWGKRIDNSFEDSFSVEDQVTRAIVAAIKGKIDVTDRDIAIRKPTKDMKSYDLLMRGVFHSDRFNPEDNKAGIELLLECLQSDPDNAVVHNHIYQSYITNWLSGWHDPRSETLDKAGYHVRRAMQLDPDIALVQANFAEYMLFIEDWDAAEVHSDRAIRLNPNEPATLATVSAILAGLGRVEEALELADTCHSIDPFHPWIDWVAGAAYYRGKRYRDALNTFKNMPIPVDEIDGWIAACYHRLGEPQKAQKHLKLYIEIARKNMGKFPETLDDWHQLWKSTASFRPDKGIDYPFDALCDAGLKQFVETAAITDSQQDLHSIAILPFDNLSGDPEQEYFSDGITESIILNLSLFPSLQVKSKNSSFAFKQQIKSLGEISKELAVDYIVEGSIRKAGEHIRITVQLIEAESGNQIWGNRYESDNDRLFELEEDLSRQIANTITGRIESDLERVAIAKSASTRKSYDLLLAGKYYSNKFTREDNEKAIGYLEQCLAQDPNNVQAHAQLYVCHSMNWMENWVLDFDESFRLARKHSQKAIAIDPDNVLAQWTCAEYLIFSRDNDKAARLVDKSLAANPHNPDLLATRAFNCNMLGDFKLGLECAAAALKMDPYHSWASWVLAEAELFIGQPEAAINTILNSKTVPGFFNELLALAYLRTGEIDKARTSVQELLRTKRETRLSVPNTRDEWSEYWYRVAPYKDTSFMEGWIEDLIPVGLLDEIDEPLESADDVHLPTVVVMPFDNLSGDPQKEYFSDGITESVILSLSSFKALTVKSRHFSFAFKDSDKSVREIGDELGVQYVVEGSVRHSPNKVRVTVQLVEAHSDNQVWGKRYDTDLDQLFDLEEELSQTIAGTIYGRIGKQVKLSTYQKPAKNLISYDYLMRGWYHAEKLNIKDTIISIEQLQKCIEIDPQNADAHSLIAAEYAVLLFENWTTDRPETLNLARQHIEKALELEPDNPTAHGFMSEYLHFRRDFERSLYHAEKAIELNPTFPDGYSMKAMVLANAHRHEEAVDLVERSLQLDPYHPYSGWNAGDVFRYAGELDRAIQAYRSVPHTPPSVIAQIAACLAEIGKTDAARSEMKVYHEMAHQQMPVYPTTIAQWRQLWYENYNCQYEEDFEALFDALLKAGLCDEIEDHSDDMPSIAVLPFENMSGDPEQEYFSDGITSDIIATLSRIRCMHVIARHSTQVYKDRKASIEEIAAEQQVRYILEGSIRKSGNRVRINAELIDSNTGQNCWSESYDRDLDDIFAVQDEITQSITIAMKVLLRDGDRAREQGVGTKIVKAWEFCTRAVELQDSYIADNLAQARELVRSALELDPEYSFAWTVLGWVHWQEAYLCWTNSFDATLDEAEEAARKALELDPASADAWSLTGTIHQIRGRPEEAIAACLKAVSIAPGNAEAQALMAWTFCYAGEPERALPFYQTALRLSPICPGWFLAVGGNIHQLEGRLQEAIATFRQSIAIEPESPLVRFYLLHALLEVGEDKQARLIAEEIRVLDNAFKVSGLIRANSYDSSERNRFQANLEKMGFNE